MKKEFGFESYTTKTMRELFNEAYLVRKKKNKKYSLRAFARDLSLPHGSLSEFLRGKRKLSTAKLYKMFNIISGESTEIDKILKSNVQNPQGYRIMSDEEIESLNHWYFDPLLELLKIEEFKNDPEWMAWALGLKKATVILALSTLEKLNWIKKDSHGIWQILEDHTSTLGKINQKKLILNRLLNFTELQKKAILNEKIEESSLVGITLAINDQDLPEARIKIYNFLNEMSNYLERKSVSKNRVYRMNIALFPLSKSKQKS
jgi:uncharacterized protein (TIGR02147 family)